MAGEPGGITKGDLGAGVVSEDKLAEAVKSLLLGTGRVVKADIAEGAVSEDKLVEALRVHSGYAINGADQTAENTHRAITGLSIETPSIINGQVLVVWFSATLRCFNDVVTARLTVDGIEEGMPIEVAGASSEVEARATATTVVRVTGLTGKHTLAAQVWGTAATGGTQTEGAQIYYEIRSA